MIYVSDTQRGNELLNYLSVSSWVYSSTILADYEINYTTSILFLSLKYFVAKPEYIYERISKIHPKQVNVLLILLDVPNFNLSLRELFKNTQMTCILCRSYQECSYYIKGFSKATNKSFEKIRKKNKGIDAFIESIAKINKTDCINLKTMFSNLQDIFKASKEELSKVPGLGTTKSEMIMKYFTMPFKNR